jgi:hypothetical protein
LNIIAEGVGVPQGSLKYEGTFIGGSIGDFMGLFSIPKGPYECSFVVWTSDGGKTFYIGPSSPSLMVEM